MSVDLPPRYVVAPAKLVFADLPRTIVLTGIRIWALGWRHNYEYTGPIDEEDLLELLGLRRAALFEHLRRLMVTGMLRYATTGSRFTFDFTATLSASRAPPGRQRASPEIWTRQDMSVDDDDVQVSTESVQKQHQQQDGRAREALQELGVMEPTRSELLGLRWVTEDYLHAWAEWWAEQDGLGLGFLVQQWRGGERAPETLREREVRVRRDTYARYNIQT